MPIDKRRGCGQGKLTVGHSVGSGQTCSACGAPLGAPFADGRPTVCGACGNAQAVDAFDPYARWLGAPPGPRPPNHYVLLGISRGTADEGIIHAAASERLQRVRDLASHAQKALRDKLLIEIKTAEVTLANPATRASYDATLPPIASYPSPAPVFPPPIAVASSPPVAVPFVPTAAAPPEISAFGGPAASVRAAPYRRPGINPWLPAVIVALVGACLFVGWLIYHQERRPQAAEEDGERPTQPKAADARPVEEVDQTAPGKKSGTTTGKAPAGKNKNGQAPVKGQKQPTSPDKNAKALNATPQPQQPSSGKKGADGKAPNQPLPPSLQRTPEEVAALVETFAKELTDSPAPNIRRAAATNLRGFGADASPAIPALRRGLADMDNEVKLNCCETLAAIGVAAVEALPDLAALASIADTPVNVRGAAGNAMIAIDPKSKEVRKMLTWLLVGGSGTSPRRLADNVAIANRTWALQAVARVGEDLEWSRGIIKEIVDDATRDLDRDGSNEHLAEGLRALVAMADDPKSLLPTLKKYQRPNALRAKDEGRRRAAELAIDSAIRALENRKEAPPTAAP